MGGQPSGNPSARYFWSGKVIRPRSECILEHLQEPCFAKIQWEIIWCKLLLGRGNANTLKVCL